MRVFMGLVLVVRAPQQHVYHSNCIYSEKCHWICLLITINHVDRIFLKIFSLFIGSSITRTHRPTFVMQTLRCLRGELLVQLIISVAHLNWHATLGCYLEISVYSLSDK